jgi:hypothetical protein
MDQRGYISSGARRVLRLCKLELRDRERRVRQPKSDVLKTPDSFEFLVIPL